MFSFFSTYSGLSLLLALSFPGTSLSAKTSGSFNVLSYNVAGLPELLSSGDPAVNTPLISPRLKAYSVINVQEDFNYHAALYASDTHAYRTPTSGGAAIGSGLNSLSNFMYIDLERISWDDCNLNSGDCLTPKGFTFARVLISDGLWVDLYNLHTDAGSDDGDRTARAANLAQVSEFMQSRSAGMPVVVMGDTNARYSNDVDGTTLRTFVQQNGLEDAWIQVTRGGTPPALNTDALVCPFPFASGVTQAQMLACETVDKIFVRGSEAVPLLSPTSFTNENGAFLNSSGSPLSDHYPISAVLEWILSSSIRLGDSIGGPHGTVFNDIPGVITEDNVPALSSITLRAGDRVDGLTYTVSSSTVTHGGTGGTAKTLSLKSGEYIVQVTACSAQHSTHTRIFYLQFTTNLGSTLEGGVSTSDCLTTTVPTDAGNGGAWGLVGFWGRGGEEVDRIAPIWGAVY